MLPTDNPTVGQPTCNIVISKDGEIEQVCDQSATQMVTLVNPDNQSQVLAIVLVCDLHDKALESGKALIAVSENGEDRIGIQYKSTEEVRDDADEPNGA